MGTMPGLEKPAPGTASGSTRDELAYYKSQYEQLEAELADFQSSSRELEAELEKDIEASEKRERQLKEKVDNLRYEVDEWKVRFYSRLDPALGQVLTIRCRPSTNKPSQKPTRPRIHYRKRSPLCGMQTGLCS